MDIPLIAILIVFTPIVLAYGAALVVDAMKMMRPNQMTDEITKG